MAAHLTDRTKKKIIREYVEGASSRKLAEKYKVSSTTILRVVKSDPKLAQKVAQKKDENTLDMLSYMDSRTKNIQKLLDMMFDAMSDPERLSEASMRDLATCAGILIDKFAKYRTDEDTQTLRTAKELLEGVPSVID